MLGLMDFTKPISSLIPGATGRILEVLAASHAELSLRTLAGLAGVSPSQASRVLPRLVQLGVVTRREVPPSSMFRLNRDHLASGAIVELRRSHEKLHGSLRELCAMIAPPPRNVTLFGSAAKGLATTSSDLDVLVVRPRDVDPSDESWSTSLADWTERVERLTGNPVNVVEAGEEELDELLASETPLWRVIEAEGRTVAGEPFGALVRAR